MTNDSFGTGSTISPAVAATGFTHSESPAQFADSADQVDLGSIELRPLLTLQQAAAFLGKSVRTLERSLLGRWGNKLPEGWTSRKIKTSAGEEWRIVPPPGLKLRSHNSASSDFTPQNKSALDQLFDSIQIDHLAEPKNLPAKLKNEHNNTLQHHHSTAQQTIIIDRTEEVETLLRELLASQRSLAEERRSHIEDLRLISQLQANTRLLESSASESARQKEELERNKQALELSRRELDQLKAEYDHLVALPWWKRLFGSQPQPNQNKAD